MNTLTNSIGMKLVYIPSGSFMMGSPENEACRDDDERQHEVILSQSYHLGQTVVTQGQWEAVMGTQPWSGRDCVRDGDAYPAVWISWEDATEFCKKLSALPSERAAGRVYRLPTEAEWEYACRAGTTTTYSFGNSASGLSDHAWFIENTDRVGEKYAHQVGQKLPNAWGLYDMHGNVEEWCMDWYGEYPRGSVTDPVGASSGSIRVLRGGAWCSIARDCRSAIRSGYEPSYRNDFNGFRVTCVPSGQ